MCKQESLDINFYHTFQLPFLHCTSWDEVVEERFLGNPRLCGFPTCGEGVISRTKKQKYHIDRMACKIFEYRMESDMYCSRACMLRSASIRAQLADEPLWLSGDVSRRMRVSFKIENACEQDTKKTVEIEVVRAVEEKLSDLRIREADSSTESDADDDADHETNVEGFLDSVASMLVPEESADTECNPPKATTATLPEPSKKGLNAPSTNKISPTCKANPKVKTSISPSCTQNSRLPDVQMSSKHRFTSSELEKLSRLRSKYSTRGQKKPILVDHMPSPLSLSAAEKPASKESGDSDQSAGRRPSLPSVQKIMDDVRLLFRSWMTDRTRQLLRNGGLCVSSSTDEIMKQFYQPLVPSTSVDRNEVVLPTVDNIDIQKKRLHIFLESVKKQLSTYQKDMNFLFSEFNWLYVIAGTFHLEPTTITNFENDVLKLVCLVLLKLISKLDVAVEDALFPSSHPSERFTRSLTGIGMDVNGFTEFMSEVLGEEQCGSSVVNNLAD
ncbi:unnamed protein product [Nippostrongylus brasiliensis]|uniref:RNA polymerase II subunit B1 CTD phosphatase RPAP2 homolog n=1 Tax=Nippostrongylus brasiliensis TaxID=27835 RepID=A0A0N4YGW0_NIPBR|nr:unnamed protein product [Nippostrongylus brasiliensis]